jgi:hypothetical protein
MSNPDNPNSAANPFNAPPNEPTTPQERIERFIDTRLNQLLEQQCEKVNEGNNGAILKLHINDVPEDLLATLKEAGVILESDQAVKVLKFYSLGNGEREFKMQQRAYEIISRYEGEADLAKIPKPHLYRDLTMLPEVREKLRANGIERVGDKVELLMMDFVPGEDLATIMFREIIRSSPRTRDLVHQIDRLRFDDLEAELPRALNLPEAKSTYRDEADRQNQEKRQQILRYDAIHAELAKQGFRLHPAILRQVRNTFELLHENGLSHRDGHHRNFMIVGNPSADAAEDPQVYIVDFGSAVSYEGDYEDNKQRIYSEGWGSGDPKRLTDEDILASLKNMCGGGETAESKSMKLFKKRLETSRKELVSERDGRKFLQILKNLAENGTVDFSSKYASCPTRPKRPLAFMSALLELQSEDIISETQLLQNIESASEVANRSERIELKRALVILQK